MIYAILISLILVQWLFISLNLYFDNSPKASEHDDSILYLFYSSFLAAATLPISHFVKSVGTAFTVFKHFSVRQVIHIFTQNDKDFDLQAAKNSYLSMTADKRFVKQGSTLYLTSFLSLFNNLLNKINKKDKVDDLINSILK